MRFEHNSKYKLINNVIVEDWQVATLLEGAGLSYSNAINIHVKIKTWVSIYIKLNDQSQVFRILYAIWPKSKDLYPTYNLP